MKRYFAIVFFLLLVQCPAFAAEMDAATALTFVRNWLLRNNDALLTESQSIWTAAGVTTVVNQEDEDLYHVVSLSPSGFAIVSTNDAIHPIIAFSGRGRYVYAPDKTLAFLLENDLSNRLESIQIVERTKDQTAYSDARKAMDKARTVWSDGLQPAAAEKGVTSVSFVRVPSLVLSRWGQDQEYGFNCYNYYTPNNYVCGCVATAGAQVIRYFEYGSVQKVGHSYTVYVNGSTTSYRMLGGN